MTRRSELCTGTRIASNLPPPPIILCRSTLIARTPPTALTSPSSSLSVSLQLRDVRRELQDALHERDVAVSKCGRVDDLEETVSELRRHNRELEDQVTRPAYTFSAWPF